MHMYFIGFTFVEACWCSSRVFVNGWLRFTQFMRILRGLYANLTHLWMILSEGICKFWLSNTVCKGMFPDYSHVQLYHRVSLLYQYMARSPRTWKVGRSNPGRCRLRSLKQVVRAPLLNARQQDWVSLILGGDHINGWPMSPLSL